MINKNKYSAIFALCCMLSCRVGAAASSSLDQPGTWYDWFFPSQEERVFTCYTKAGLNCNDRQINRMNPNSRSWSDLYIRNETGVENPETIQINGTNGIMSYNYNDGKHTITTSENQVFELFINNRSLCMYKNKEKKEMNLIVVDFHVDPNDPTKATFEVLKEFTDTFTIPQTNEEREKQEKDIEKIQNDLREYGFDSYSGEMRDFFYLRT